MRFDWTALILGLMMFYIAFQQWITAEKQRKQELFELRYEKLYKMPFELLNKIPEKMDDEESKDEIIQLMDEYRKYKSYIPIEKYQRLKRKYNKSEHFVMEFLEQKITKEDYLKEINNIRIEYYKELEPLLLIEPCSLNIWEIIYKLLIGFFNFLGINLLVYYIKKKVGKH